MGQALRGLPRHHLHVFQVRHFRKGGCTRVTSGLSLSIGAIRTRVAGTLQALQSRLRVCVGCS